MLGLQQLLSLVQAFACWPSLGSLQLDRGFGEGLAACVLKGTFLVGVSMAAQDQWVGKGKRGGLGQGFCAKGLKVGMEFSLFQFQLLQKSPFSPHPHMVPGSPSPSSLASLLDPLSSQGPAQHFRGALWLGAGEAPSGLC